VRKLHPILALAAALLCLSPAAARADRVPPGVSGAGQYTESLPGPGGEEATRDLGDRGKRQPAHVLGGKNAAELESLGPEGEAAAKLAAATAPEAGGAGGRGAGGGHGAGGNGGGRLDAGAAAGASSGAGQVVGQIAGTSGSGGMGVLLPLLIAAAILAAAGYALLRRRAAGGQD
jgi:hypothetical protein